MLNTYDLAEQVIDKADTEGRVATAEDIAAALHDFEQMLIQDINGFMESRIREGGDALFYNGVLRAIYLWERNRNYVEGE